MGGEVAEPSDPLDAALRLARVLEAAGVSYALGGALACGLWGVPCATVDVEVNLFLGADQLDDVVVALRGLGIQCDPAEARSTAEREGLVVLRFGGYRIDLFTASIDFAWEAERTRVRHSVGGEEAWFLSAEALAVFKLLFFRAKDVVDLERLVAVQGERLDAAWVRRNVVAMMGDDDDRVKAWDRIVAEFRGGGGS